LPSGASVGRAGGGRYQSAGSDVRFAPGDAGDHLGRGGSEVETQRELLFRSELAKEVDVDPGQRAVRAGRMEHGTRPDQYDELLRFLRDRQRLGPGGLRVERGHDRHGDTDRDHHAGSDEGRAARPAHCRELVDSGKVRADDAATDYSDSVVPDLAQCGR